MNTNLKTGLLTVTLVITTLISFAQQEPTSALFWNNYIHTNPAMTGAGYKHQANVTWKNYTLKKQYGLPPYQQTIFASYSAKIERIKSGIGAGYRYDSHPGQEFQTGFLSYAYHIPIKSMFLSVGISGGIKTLTGRLPNSSGGINKWKFDPAFTSDFGIALRHEKWNVGISATQWNSPALHTRDSIDVVYNMTPHFWLFGDYRFSLGENWSLTPRVQFVMDKVSIHSNVQVQAAWKENLWFGVGVQNVIINSSNIFVSPMIGYDIKGRFRLGYTAVISTRNNNYMFFNRTTHEAVLSFLLK